MVTYNDDTRTATGTAGHDVLKGKPSAPWKLIGLGGDDTYHLRIAEYVRKIVAGSTVIYERYRGVDNVVEKIGGGHDTVILVNGYRSANSIAASQLANIEDIKVASGETQPWRIVTNGLSNLVVSGAGGDTLLGQGGADRMFG